MFQLYLYYELIAVIFVVLLFGRLFFGYIQWQFNSSILKTCILRKKKGNDVDGCVDVLNSRNTE